MILLCEQVLETRRRYVLQDCFPGKIILRFISFLVVGWISEKGNFVACLSPLVAQIGSFEANPQKQKNRRNDTFLLFLKLHGALGGNRTHVSSFGGQCSSTILRGHGGDCIKKLKIAKFVQ